MEVLSCRIIKSNGMFWVRKLIPSLHLHPLNHSSTLQILSKLLLLQPICMIYQDIFIWHLITLLQSP